MARYRLRLKKLDFISAVDAGAQGDISNVALIKRHDAKGIEATFEVAKLDESLGLVFGWAMAGSLDGGATDHVDLQGDAIDVSSNEFIKITAQFMEDAAHSDVMHDGDPDGRIVFAMPLVPEVNKALGIESNVHGLAIAMRPSPETFKRFQSGELRAFSIAGIGERVPLEKSVEKHPPGSIDTRSLAAELASKSTHSSAAPTVKTMSNEAELSKRIAELEVQLVDANKYATLNDAQRAYHKSLYGDAAASFLAKSFDERQSIIAEIEKRNEVVYTSKSTGETFRKSDDPRLVTMAKRQDEQAVELAKRDAEIEKQAIRAIAKARIGKLAGTDDVHDYIVASIRKGGGDEATINAALETLSGANAAMSGAARAAGVNTGEEPAVSDADAQLEKLAKAHAEKTGMPFAKAYAHVFATPEGRAIYATKPVPVGQ